MNRGTQVTRMGTARLVAMLLLAACLGLPVMAGAQVAQAASAEPDQPADMLVPPPAPATSPPRSWTAC